MLVSWTRLLAGRWGDPLVGRDVLLGVAVGAVVVLAIPFVRVVALRWLGLPPLAPFGDLDLTLSPRLVLAGLVDITVGALANAMLFVLILIAYRLVLRREALAAAAFMVTLSLQSALASPLPFLPALLLNVLGIGGPLYFVVRQGVLLTVVAVFVANLMAAFPVPPSLGHWAADPAIATICVVSALAIYGFRTAQRGHRGRIPEEVLPSGG
jgi:hypothetical protein